MRENDRDVLRELDWSQVYASVPGAVDDGVRVAFMRIRQRRMRRRRMARWVACAACLALVAGAAAVFLSRGQSAPDRVVPLAPEMTELDGDSEVYASREDAHFHLRSDCGRIEGEVVALKLVTALEFEKELCPVCGANVLPEGY